MLTMLDKMSLIEQLISEIEGHVQHMCSEDESGLEQMFERWLVELAEVSVSMSRERLESYLHIQKMSECELFEDMKRYGTAAN